MTTRCRIIVKNEYTTVSIYRHSDGYPEGVLADIKVALEKGLKRGLSDPEYFLANFIFMAKFSAYMRWKKEEKTLLHLYLYDYGVCPPDRTSDDWSDYIYEIDGEKREIVIKVRAYDHKQKMYKWGVIFKGSLEKAFEKYISKEFENGCHINAELFPDVEEY